MAVGKVRLNWTNTTLGRRNDGQTNLSFFHCIRTLLVVSTTSNESDDLLPKYYLYYFCKSLHNLKLATSTDADGHVRGRAISRIN